MIQSSLLRDGSSGVFHRAGTVSFLGLTSGTRFLQYENCMCDIYILGQLKSGRFHDLPPGLPLSVEVELFQESEIETHFERLSRMISSSRSVACRSDEVYIWNYPIDSHFVIESAEGMIRLFVKLVSQDGATLAVGSCGIHPRPGCSQYTCRLIRPTLSREQELLMAFLGETSLIAEVPRFREPCGYVEVELNIITRGFESNNLLT